MPRLTDLAPELKGPLAPTVDRALEQVAAIRAAFGEPGYFDLFRTTMLRDDEAGLALADSIG